MNAAQAELITKLAREAKEKYRIEELVPAGIKAAITSIADDANEGKEYSPLPACSRMPEVRQHLTQLGFYVSHKDYVYWGQAKQRQLKE